jgi:prepilin-type processing-associated H-X9-DG protein
MGKEMMKNNRYFSVFIRFVPIAIAVLLSISFFNYRKNQYRQRCKADGGNLHVIGNALLMYALDNYGKLPSSLSELVSDNHIGLTGVFSSPIISGSTAPTMTDLEKGNIDYLYYGKSVLTSFESPSKHVIMHTRFNGSKQWVNFLFLDGHTEGLEVTSLAETLSKNGWIIHKPKQPQPSPNPKDTTKQND